MAKKMEKYSAIITFDVLEFEAENDEDANDKIHKLLDELQTAETSLTWDNVWPALRKSDG